VPAPKQNFSLCVKYKAGSKEQDWTDIFFKINSDHQNNRLCGNESILLAFSNTLRYYAGSVEEKSEMIRDKNSNINFMMLEKAVRAYLQNSEHGNISDLKIMVTIHSIDKNNTHSHFYSQKD
jgi:hypothetical protein